jgi:hypothetical protein
LLAARCWLSLARAQELLDERMAEALGSEQRNREARVDPGLKGVATKDSVGLVDIQGFAAASSHAHTFETRMWIDCTCEGWL